MKSNKKGDGTVPDNGGSVVGSNNGATPVPNKKIGIKMSPIFSFFFLPPKTAQKDSEKPTEREREREREGESYLFI